MAYVAPNSTIELMSGVNLTPDYKDTIYFASESAQSVYFSGKVVKRFHNQMYTRISNNVCRVECNASEIMYCDYIRFRNDRVIETNKYYYGFITKVEYINENVSEITFEIDELQTWLFNQYCSLGMCFIERQHCSTADDIRGANLVPEPIEVGEHIAINHDDQIANGGTDVILVCLGAVTLTQTASGSSAFWTQSMFGGFPSTVKYFTITASNLNLLVNSLTMENGFYKGLLGIDDLWAILGVYSVPSGFILNGQSVAIGTASIPITLLGMNGYDSGVLTPSNSIPTVHGENYTPKNNKLLTYPYTFFRISTPISHQDLKYETFGGNPSSAKIRVYGTCNPVPVLTLLPVNYDGPDEDFNFGLNVDSFPMPVVYQSGVLNSIGATVGNGVKTAVKVLAAAAGDAISGGVLYGALPAVAGGILGGKEELSKANLIVGGSNKIESSGGNQSLAAYMASNTFRFVTYQMGLRKKTAELFDQFFSKYGYAQNKVDTPNLHVRSKWTYIKTRGAIVNGGIPSTAKTLISRVLDNGITFWDSTVTVGNYGDFTNP